MRIKQEFKKSGNFWLPSEPNKKVTGTLSISDGGIIELEVVGRFMENNDGLRRIIGQTEDGRMATLDDCNYKIEQFSLFATNSKSVIHVDRAFIGVHYDEDESPTFNSLTFSVEGLDEWVAMSGIKDDSQYEKNTVNISYQPPANVSLKLNNGMLLKITFRYTSATKSFEYKLNQKTYFKLTSQNARKLDEFISVVRRITLFLCFALDQTVSLDSLSATSDNLRRDIGEGKTSPIPIDIYYPSWPYSKNEPDLRRGKLFKFQDIQNDAEAIINNWIGAYEKIAPAFRLYFLAKMGMQIYLEEKFLTLIQGLEAFHRRKSDEKHNVRLKNRIKGIIEPFEDVIGDKDKQCELIDTIVKTRNYLTHYNPTLELKAVRGKDLWPLCLKMELLFQLHFLDLIGFSREQIDSIVANVLKSRGNFNNP